MPKVQDTDEVRILRYFEEGTLEKAELLFHIIAECESACRRGDLRPKRRTRAPKQGATKKPVLPRSQATKSFHDLVRTAALTATRSFNQTVRCISIQACDAGQGVRTDLLVTDLVAQGLAPVETPAALMVIWH